MQHDSLIHLNTEREDGYNYQPSIINMPAEDEENDMDMLVEQIERVMESESGSGGATFGMLRRVCCLCLIIIFSKYLKKKKR